VSPSISAQTGHLPEDIIGKTMFGFLEADSAHRALAAINVVLDESACSDVQSIHEFVVQCRDGCIKTIEASIVRLLGEDGKVNGTLGVMRDISDRKRAEQDKELLQQAYQQAQKLEAIGTLAGGVAHDFNNLLTGVLGHADMLKHEFQGSPDSLRSVELIEMAATRAKNLTSQLLGFARKGKFMQVPVDIDKIISDLLGLLEHTVDKNITLTRISSARNPLVLGDPGQISQIFLNLAVNARDAMPTGGALTFKTEIFALDELSSYASFGLEPCNYCVVSVSDTGIGIAEDKLERIFEPFYTDKEEGKGTGLGLAMVYGVVKNHKGGVRVYSEVGKGSVFKVFLPLHEGATTVTQKSQGLSLVHGNGKVLLIDDEPLVRQVCEKMLRRLGYEVVIREDGAEGLDYYRDHWSSIDVVLIDMIMPKMGGIESLNEMKKINPALKAILCTGFSREDIAEKIKESHILGFIQKPYRFQELSEVVARVITFHELVA
jgi:PAS domain S-box-containing protein